MRPLVQFDGWIRLFLDVRTPAPLYIRAAKFRRALFFGLDAGGSFGDTEDVSPGYL